MAPSVSLSDSDYISEVRDALAEIGTSMVPDDTITQAKDRWVQPGLNKFVGNNPDQTKYDNAAIAWGAELSFNAYLAKTQMTDSSLQVTVNVGSYRRQLKMRTDLALSVLGITRSQLDSYPVIINSINLES